MFYVILHFTLFYIFMFTFYDFMLLICLHFMPVLGDLNERAISLEEVREAVNEMRSGKVQGRMDFRWNV